MTEIDEASLEISKKPLWVFEAHNGFGRNAPDGEPWPLGYISECPGSPIFELRPMFFKLPEKYIDDAKFIMDAIEHYHQFLQSKGSE